MEITAGTLSATLHFEGCWDTGDRGAAESAAMSDYKHIYHVHDKGIAHKKLDVCSCNRVSVALSFK